MREFRMEFTFVVESMIRGYHEYKTVWENPVLAEELRCTREIGNPRDPAAVAIQKQISGEMVIVGHVPKRISALSSVFIRRGGVIKSVVSGPRRYSADLEQGGLEIPCLLYFTIKNERSSLIGKVGELSTVSSMPISTEVELEKGTALEQPSTVVVSEQTSNNSENDTTEVTIDVTKTIENSPPRKKQKQFDAECIIMGHELSDVEINLAQRFLKAQFKKLNGLQSTLLQEKVITPREVEIENKLQLIFCKQRKHWVVATTIYCDRHEVAVYDSLFAFLDKETKEIVENLFSSDTSKLNIKMARCQKQKRL